MSMIRKISKGILLIVLLFAIVSLSHKTLLEVDSIDAQTKQQAVTNQDVANSTKPIMSSVMVNNSLELPAPSKSSPHLSIVFGAGLILIASSLIIRQRIHA